MNEKATNDFMNLKRRKFQYSMVEEESTSNYKLFVFLFVSRQTFANFKT